MQSPPNRRANRRDFLAATAAATAGLSLGNMSMSESQAAENKKPLFKISLAEWSLHRMLQAEKLKNIDFPSFTKSEFGIEAVEYVNQFFKDKAKDTAYLTDLKQRAADVGVANVLIMIDGEGHLGAPDEAERLQAAENHFPWVEAAKFLGCHSIRVNAHSEGSREEQAKLAADGLRKLSEFAAPHKINILVENHGGLSSDGAWLTGVMNQVDLPNCGTLPDFGNFRTGKNEDGTDIWYDRYQGTAELMPYAKAVSAKTNAFDEAGNETQSDYLQLMKIVLDAGYHGHVGIEWEGEQPDEVEGIHMTKRLLERVRDELASS